MKKIYIAATLAIAALALTACSSGGGNGGGNTNPTTAGTTDLKIGNFLDVTSWDPALADIGFDGPYLSAVYDPLIALDAKGNPIPALATSWKVSSDFSTVTLNLRSGVKFSDGEAFNAKAAVTNLDHLKAGARSGEAYVNVASFTAVGADTVKITMAQRDDTMLYLMGLGRSYMAAPKAIEADSLAKTPVGSGPYTLDTATSTSGSIYNFTPVKGYWDAKLYPFTKLSIRPILDQTARNNALQSGQINVNYGAAADIPKAKQNGWTVTQKPSQWIGLQFTDHTGAKFKPLGDVRVRQALNYAFDGVGMLKSIGQGAGVASNQVFPAATSGNESSLNDMYAYNVKKAKSLMAAAGYANGFTLHMPMSPIFQTWQAVAQQSLKAIGVKVIWDNMQQPDYQTKAGSYPMFISVLAMDSNPVATVNRQVVSKQWYNPNPDYASNADLKAAVDKVESTQGATQVSATADLNALLTKNAWWSVWYQGNNIYISSDGIKVTPVTGMMFPTLRYIQHG